MKIKTNNQPREVLTWYDLTPDEQKEFDYLEEGDGSFFRYKSQAYDLGNLCGLITRPSLISGTATLQIATSLGCWCGILRIVNK